MWSRRLAALCKSRATLWRSFFRGVPGSHRCVHLTTVSVCIYTVQEDRLPCIQSICFLLPSLCVMEQPQAGSIKRLHGELCMKSSARIIEAMKAATSIVFDYVARRKTLSFAWRTSAMELVAHG